MSYEFLMPQQAIAASCNALCVYECVCFFYLKKQKNVIWKNTQKNNQVYNKSKQTNPFNARNIFTYEWIYINRKTEQRIKTHNTQHNSRIKAICTWIVNSLRIRRDLSKDRRHPIYTQTPCWSIYIYETIGTKNKIYESKKNKCYRSCIHLAFLPFSGPDNFPIAK